MQREESVQRVVVVGLGYVGLPSAVCLAKAGFVVTGCDVRESVVDAIRHGRSPLADGADDATIRELVEAGKLTATTDTSAAVAKAQFVIVCVPTPVHDDHMPDLGPLESASRAIGRGLRAGTVVSYESTTFPGCTMRVCVPILEKESRLRAGADFGLAYCPERLNPGDDAHTAERTPRVLGALDERSLRIARSVYARILQEPPHECPDIATAEASKVLENVQRDVNIALMNEFAAMSRAMGLDAGAVLDAASTKYNFYPVRPGPGVGGHCIPVDPYYLIEEARRFGFEPRLMALARVVNDDATRAVAEAIQDRLPREGRVAVLGLAYKGGVGDLRESPAVRIVEMLREGHATLSVHDPHVEPAAIQDLTGGRGLALEESVCGADVIAILTDHPEFAAIDWAVVSKLATPGACVVDARDTVDPAALKRHGLTCWSVAKGVA